MDGGWGCGGEGGVGWGGLGRGLFGWVGYLEVLGGKGDGGRSAIYLACGLVIPQRFIGHEFRPLTQRLY